MKNKIVTFNVLLVTISMIIFMLFGITITKNNYEEAAKEKAKEIAAICASNYTDASACAKKTSDGIRITVIDSSGVVLADSDREDVSKMENHIDREEILGALQNKPIAVKRHSATLKTDMIYYAVKADAGSDYVFIRVAIPVQKANSYVGKTLPIMIAILIVIVAITVTVTAYMSIKFLKPLKDVESNLKKVKNGTYSEIMPSTNDAEVNKILVEINSISQTLQDTLSMANEDKEKLNYVLNNISDGIIALDNDSDIVLMNDVAKSIFKIKDPINKSSKTVINNEILNTAIENCLNDYKDRVLEFKSEKSEIYFVSVRKVDKSILMIVLSNITALKNNEKTRSEFFANASHELKTPLTAIKGFNEIVEMESKETVAKDFCSKISKEISRMQNLIDDMLNLSKLENQKQLTLEECNIKEVVSEVLATLEPQIAEKKMSINTNVEEIVYIEKEHLIELIKNLTENAIRYNNEKGSVNIDAKTTEKGIVLSVEDNGIGIDEKHQTRIFERFYRVQKSRSRETGGTGLGLSIVKHICDLYKAELSLTSKVGLGTKIEIIFKK